MEMYNPLLDPRPNDPIAEIHAYARDLAFLALKNELRSGSKLPSTNWIHADIPKGPIHELIMNKWGKGQIEDKSTPLRPNYETLMSFGYMERVMRNDFVEYFLVEYFLTTKAFHLLNSPSQAPSIFISYRRKESSAFALLIEARLQLKGSGGVFIDRDIPGGELWEEHIRTQIASSSVFVALLGKTALSADSWVARELNWAAQAKCRIIPIWHNGHNLTAQREIGEVPAVLHERQSYTLKDESALEYDTAIIWLLNTLGYRS